MLYRRDFARGTSRRARNRQWMAVFADCDRVGAEHEFQRFAFRHLAVVEHVPLGARAAVGLAAFQFGAQKRKAGVVFEQTRERRPLDIFLVVEIPMIALAADEPQLPAIRRPVGWIFTGSRRVRIRQPNARGGRCRTVGILASYNWLQIHRVFISAGLYSGSCRRLSASRGPAVLPATRNRNS